MAGHPVDKDKFRCDKVLETDLIYKPASPDIRTYLYPDWSRVEILDQGPEGACTGYGLAAVINYQNFKNPEEKSVNPDMLYRNAQKHDHLPGERNEVSTARGALIGWEEHGVCPTFEDWERGRVTKLYYPRGAYRRIGKPGDSAKKRTHDVQAALAETGAVYATAEIFEGWLTPKDGKICWEKGKDAYVGDHTFAVLGYNQDGFLIQNSWDDDYGRGIWTGHWGGRGLVVDGIPRFGIALWTYDDFEANGRDFWLARVAPPVLMKATHSGS